MHTRRGGRDVARYRRRVRVVELLVSVGLGGVVWLALGPQPAAIPALALAAVAPALTRIDLAEHRLPNRIVVPTILAGVAGLALAGLAPGGWAPSGLAPGGWTSGGPASGAPIIPLAASACYAGMLLVLALFGGMGMGDVKLAAALGLASPATLVAVVSPLLALLSGGVAAVAVLIRRGRTARLAFGPFLLGGYFGALALMVVVRAM